MNNQQSSIVFDEKTAASYDKKTDLWAPGREALFLFMRMILAELPADARILCVGVGTGTELIALAQAFPQWQFAAVEPAPAMLEVCRRKAEESGVESRCTFHEGYLDSLPTTEPFDAATCLLVSHFFTQPEERSDFFHQIALRLRPKGILISSDLVLGMAPSAYQSLLEVWFRMLEASGWTEEEMGKVRAAYGHSVAALKTSEIESIIAAGGFDAPVLFFQTLLIHAWYSRRSASN